MAKSKTAELLAMFARFLPPMVARFCGRGRGRGRVQLPRSGVWAKLTIRSGIVLFHFPPAFLFTSTGAKFKVKNVKLF